MARSPLTDVFGWVLTMTLRAVCFLQQASLTYADVKIDPTLVRHLIGKGGVTINKIKDDSGTQINLPKPDATESVVRIEGPPEGVKQAKATIEAVIKKLENTKQIDVIIEQRLHNQLIGSGGSEIKKIIEKFNGIAINFPSSKKESDIIVLRGDRKDVDACEKYLKDQAKRLREANHELRVPVYKQFHRNVIGKGGATLKQIKVESQICTGHFVFFQGLLLVVLLCVV